MPRKLAYLLVLLGFLSGAGDGNRTHVTSLEGWNSTIELHPQRALISAYGSVRACLVNR